LFDFLSLHGQGINFKKIFQSEEQPVMAATQLIHLNFEVFGKVQGKSSKIPDLACQNQNQNQNQK
jgi:hypothetical protein